MRTVRSIAALSVLLAAHPAFAQDAERFSIAGSDVAIYNLAGTVRIEAGTGANVVVEVRRGGAHADRLNIERRDVDGRPALVVRYPAGDVVYPGRNGRGRTTLEVRGDGTFFGRGGGRERIQIRSSGSGTEAHADLRVLVPAGRAVFVKLGVGEVTASNVSGDLDIDVAAASVQSSSTRGSLRIDTGSGRVDVRNAEGDVVIDTGSGSVDVADVRGSQLLIDTGSGRVNGDGITAADVRVDTGSGAIELLRVAATTVELDTGSGGVELDLTTDVERVRIDTGSGGVRLAVPDNLGASLTVETGSGGITTDMPVTVSRRGRNHLQARIGDGRGSIEIDTGSGGVRIMKR